MELARSKLGKSLFCLLMTATILLLSGISMQPVLAVEGENLTTNVSITNAAPTIGTITCDPVTSGNFTPSVEANKTLSCWATVTDTNGYGDIDQSLFDSNFYNDTVGGADDLNTHYSNGTGSNAATNCTWTGASGSDITVNCSYNIRYFITPSAGGWTVNFTVQDSASNAGSAALTLGVATTLGLQVINTTIEYGNLALAGTSLRTTDIINTCNQQIDVRLRESQNNGYLTCDGQGSANIATSNGDTDGIKYNATTFTWPEGISLTNTQSTYTAFNHVYYDATGTTDGQSTKTLYWRIKVPASGVSGVCTGQTEIVAIAG